MDTGCMYAAQVDVSVSGRPLTESDVYEQVGVYWRFTHTPFKLYHRVLALTVQLFCVACTQYNYVVIVTV